MRGLLLLAILLLGGFSSLAFAQTRKPSIPHSGDIVIDANTHIPVLKAMNPVWAHLLSKPTNIEKVYYRTLQEHKFMDLDGNGLTRNEVQAFKNKLLQQKTQEHLRAFLAIDTNQDQRLTFDEINTQLTKNHANTPEEAHKTKQRLLSYKKADRNNDQTLTQSEFLDNFKPVLSQNEETGLLFTESLFEFDSNNDGIVTKAEQRKGVETIFRIADLDQNNVLSELEVGSFLVLYSCSFRPAKTSEAPHIIYAFGGPYYTNVASTASGAGLKGVKVTIENGPALLYLILFSKEPVLWAIEGVTSRVAHTVVVGDLENPSLILGMPRDKVSFGDKAALETSCMEIYFNKEFSTPDKKFEGALKTIAMAARKSIHKAILAANVDTDIAVPSGKVTRVSAKAATNLYPLDTSVFIGHGSPAPGGFMPIQNPQQAFGPFAYYGHKAYPAGWGGLAVLVAQNKLKQTGPTSFTAIGEITRLPKHYPETFPTKILMDREDYERLAPQPSPCIYDRATNLLLNGGLDPQQACEKTFTNR